MYTRNKKKAEKKQKPLPPTTDIHELNLMAAEDDAAPAPLHAGREDHGLISQKRQRLHDDLPPSNEWLRPYWLGSGLFLVLFSFWVLDTLKDPIFGALVGGDLKFHQPTAKLFSVSFTLFLVCFLEYVSHESKLKRQEISPRSDQEVLEAGGRWSRMRLSSLSPTSSNSQGGSGRFVESSPVEEQDRVPGSIFASICVPYVIGFGIMAYLCQFNLSVAQMTPLSTSGSSSPSSSDPTFMWHALGYFLYAGIESFGSIAVASFWSFVNSTLSLEDAERYYGLIIAIAQLGAIAGSTMVSTYVWSNITLMVVACLVIVLHVLVMLTYERRFFPTSEVIGSYTAAPRASVRLRVTIEAPHPDTSSPPTLWSGLYLVLKYNYVLLILGASCLYEVSLTCLNYQMTLLGWSRFEETEPEGMNFTRFMGHYGQMVNISSLVLSSVVFPWLIRRFGLRLTLRLFPTLLLVANFLAFGALPGNLAVLFFSMSILKAMTYSIHDPAKEILYLPTSNSIKFKGKFWIDVVGARFAKAIGSSINTVAGSVDNSIRVASAPSLLTALALWWVCFSVGTQFEELIMTHSIVGVEGDPSKYTKLTEEGEGGGVYEVDETDDALFENPTAPITSDSIELASTEAHLI